MVDLFQEVKEDLRQERLHRLWKQYGQWVVVAAILIIIGTGTSVWWNGRQQSKQAELGAKYYSALQALREGKSQEAMPQFDALRKADSASIPALAGFKMANEQLQNKKIDEALATYQAIVDNKGIEPVLRDLAALLGVSLQVEYNKADGKTITDTLKKLTLPEGVWRFSAEELQADYALRSGKKEKALEIYQRLEGDALAPYSIQKRAAEMVLALGGATKKTADNTKAITDHAKP